MSQLETLPQFLKNEIFVSWLALTVASFLLAAILKFSLHLVYSKIQRIVRSKTSVWPSLFAELINEVRKLVIFIWLFYLGALALKPEPGILSILKVLVVALTVYQIALLGIRVIRSWRQDVLQKRIDQDASSAAALSLMYFAAQSLFFATLILAGLSNLGVDIGALLAGLGVGGIAVALAAQNILGDLLASLSIVFDKPFVVGDYITVDDTSGTVEHIGVKTTRLRGLSGEEWVFSNKNLLESRIRNYKTSWHRRVIHKFGVIYSTPAEKLEMIPGWIRTQIESTSGVRFDRCHFASFGGSSLDFELVFWIESPDYNEFMDLQQKLLIWIFRKFADEKIAFAYPTQSLFFENALSIRSQSERNI